MPSLKYSLSAWPVRFTNGTTATDSAALVTTGAPDCAAGAATEDVLPSFRPAMNHASAPATTSTAAAMPSVRALKCDGGGIIGTMRVRVVVDSTSLWRTKRRTSTKPSHAAILWIAIPLREIGGLRELEHDRPLAGLDHRGDERLLALGQRGFGAHPARIDGPRGPEYDHGPGALERLLGHLVVGLAGTQRGVPPDGETVLLEAVGEAPGHCLVITVVRQEDVGHSNPSLAPARSKAGLGGF